MATDPFQAVFGGSSSQQQATSTQTPANYNPFTASLGGKINTLAQQPLPSYSGDLYANLGPNANATLAYLQGSTGAGSPNLGYLGAETSGAYLPGGTNANPFLTSAIQAAQRTTMQGLEQTLTQDLPGRFTAAGQFTQPGGSSAFDTAAALATRGAAQASSDIATNIASNAYTSERQLQQGAVQLSQQEVQNTVSNLQAQALPQMIQQQGIQNALSLFQTNLSGVLQLLATLGQIARPELGTTGTSTSTGTGTSTPGILPDIAALTAANNPSRSVKITG